jgi:hypothetical protein
MSLELYGVYACIVYTKKKINVESEYITGSTIQAIFFFKKQFEAM